MVFCTSAFEEAENRNIQIYISGGYFVWVRNFVFHMRDRYKLHLLENERLITVFVRNNIEDFM
jgi:hypothetical protein